MPREKREIGSIIHSFNVGAVRGRGGRCAALNFVGGPDFASVLIDPLASVEEAAVVRDRAVASLSCLWGAMPPPMFVDSAVPTLKRLLLSEICTSRCSAAAVVAEAYLKISTKERTT